MTCERTVYTEVLIQGSSPLAVSPAQLLQGGTPEFQRAPALGVRGTQG